MTPRLALTIDGTAYSGWTSASVALGIEQIAGEFELEVSERWPGGWAGRRIRPGDACRLELEGEPVITGYVDEWAPEYDARSHRVRILGRDAAGDLVDCSAIHGAGSWTGAGLVQIARDLTAPFGVRVTLATDPGEPFKSFALQEGETVWEALYRAGQMRGILFVSDGTGGIEGLRAGQSRHAGSLERGRNILAADGSFSHRDRYSIYKVKGQRRGTDDDADAPEALSAAGDAADTAIRRYRPLLLHAEQQGHGEDFRARAAWERATRLGRSMRTRMTVQGWREHGEDGRLWTPNFLVAVRDDWQGLDSEMLIAAVRFRLDPGGMTTELELTHPSAYALQAPAVQPARSASPVRIPSERPVAPAEEPPEEPESDEPERPAPPRNDDDADYD